MKKLFLIAATALLMSTPIYAETKNPECTHFHDEICGYNEETGKGCTHICCKENADLRSGCEWCPD